PVAQDDLVNGTGGDEDEARHPGQPGGLHELHRAHEVDLEEVQQLPPLAAAALPVQPGVDHGAGPLDPRPAGLPVAELAGKPLDRIRKAPAVAGRAVPAAARVAGRRQVADEVTPEKPRRAGDADYHGSSLPGQDRVPNVRLL